MRPAALNSLHATINYKSLPNMPGPKKWDTFAVERKNVASGGKFWVGRTGEGKGV